MIAHTRNETCQRLNETPLRLNLEFFQRNPGDSQQHPEESREIEILYFLHVAFYSYGGILWSIGIFYQK